MKEFRSKHASTKRKHDERVIEAAVFRFGPVSRVGIQELTHLHPTTISHRVRDLLVSGRLLESGPANNAMGRKQVLLKLNESHAFVVGVGFDDEYVLAGTMDLQTKLKSTVKEPAKLEEGPEVFQNQLLGCARAAMERAGVDAKAVLGMGVAGSGLMNSRDGTLVFSSTVGLGGEMPLKQIFQKQLGVPTFVEHLGRAKAVAERIFGAGAGARDMVYVEYGRTGIGAGMILDGRLVYGSGSAAGEIGHTHVLEDGPVCKCGSFGCLEAIAGAAALGSRVRRAIADGSTSEALALANGDLNNITGFTVLEAARRGDKTCAAIVTQVANYLGLGFANLVNSFNPAVLVLDSRLGLAGPDLLDQITKVIRTQSLQYSTRSLTVCLGKLGEEATLLGLGYMALERHFEVPLLKAPYFMVEALPTQLGTAPPPDRLPAHEDKTPTPDVSAIGA
jgi:N-acetylglucosamine repressor